METRLEDLRKWFGKGKKGDWVRVGTDGEIKGQCAREPGEGKPKCMPRSKAHSMDKKDRAASARRKRRKDPMADRPGTGNKPIMVKTDKKESVEMKEKFDVKYAKSKRGPIMVRSFDSAADAKKFLDQQKKQGMNGIISKKGVPVSMQRMKDMQKESIEEATFMITVRKAGPGGKDLNMKVDGKDRNDAVAKWRKAHPKYKNDPVAVKPLAVLKNKGGKYAMSYESVELDESPKVGDKTKYQDSPAVITHVDKRRQAVKAKVLSGKHKGQIVSFGFDELEESVDLKEKNVPTNPALWAKFKAQAKAKFDVYPSAYANGWAAKKYKAAGGSWKSESVDQNAPKSFEELRDILAGKRDQ